MQMIKTVDSLIAARKTIDVGLEPVMEWLKDQTESLDVRWDAFVALVDGNVLTKIKPYGDGYIETVDSSYTLYDTFYIDRYAETHYPDLLHRMEEFDNPPEADCIDEWKEQVLADGYAGFCNDW